MPPLVVENDKAKNLWDFQIQMDKLVLTNQPDIVVVEDGRSDGHSYTEWKQYQEVGTQEAGEIAGVLRLSPPCWTVKNTHYYIHWNILCTFTNFLLIIFKLYLHTSIENLFQIIFRVCMRMHIFYDWWECAP